MTYYDNVKILDEALEKFSEKEARKALALIKTDKALENYFFANVSSLKWFKFLKIDYFDPKRIPLADNDYHQFWNVLDYLERISKQISTNKNLEYGKELLVIIDNTVQHSCKQRKINNYHIWWFMVKILNNLPSKAIVDYFTENQTLNLGKFETWLLEWTNPALDSDLALHNIGEDLLGKFLNEQATIPLAELIVRVITRIREPKKKEVKYSIFNDRQDAEMTWSPYWIQDGFRKHHQKIAERCSQQVVYDLADTLKRALEYRQQEYDAILDIGKDVYQIKVSRVRQESLPKGEISFKENTYDCLVRQYTQEQLKGIDREKDFWALHKNEPQAKIAQFMLANIRAQEDFIAVLKGQLPKNILWDEAEEYDQKLNNLYVGLFEDYGHIWFRSLADHSSSHADDAQHVLAIILKDVLLAKCSVHGKQGERILKDFMTPRYPFPIFTRYCLLCMNQYWDQYRPLFAKLLDIKPDVIKESEYEVELYDLLKAHNQDFDKALNSKIMRLIEDAPVYYKKEGLKLETYWKYTKLSPLKDNPFFKEAYEQAKQKAEVKEEKPFEPHRTTVQTGWGGSKSPISKEKIAEMDIMALIAYLKEFQGADRSSAIFEGKPDKEGLADVLQASAKEHPEKFTAELEQFNQKGLYRYVHHVLWGLRDAWRAEKPLAWDKILDFSLTYVQQPWFMDDAMKDQGEDSGKYKGKYLWIVDAVVDLIEDGSRNDERAFGKEYFSRTEEIFNALMPLVKGEKQPDTQRDAVTYAINTSLGKVIESYIIFSLRVARVRQKEGEEKVRDWGNQKYERFFEKGIEAYIFLGRYLPNLKFLDEAWAEKKIKEMNNLSENDKAAWQPFMEAYLTGPYVYKDIYEWMRSNYKKAIEHKIFEESVDHRLVEHITLGYLRKYDVLREGWHLEDRQGLFEQLLYGSFSEGKRDRWPEAAAFLWSITGKREEKKKERELSEEIIGIILEFWRWTFKHRNKLKGELGEAYPSLLCNLAEFTIVLDKIDEEKEQWLLFSAPHVEKHHFASFFIEYLTLFLNDRESMKRIGRIFVEVLKHSTPTFKQEDISTIVGRLFEGDEEDKENARAICNTYGQRGVHFLKDLYYAHQ